MKKTFQWTPKEWAILEPLSEAERVNLCLRALFAKRTLTEQAKHEGLVKEALPLPVR